MSAQLFYLPFNPVFGISGLPAGAAQVFFYLSGTTTFAPVYADNGLTQRLANPVLTSALGRLPTIYLDGTIEYRVVVQDALGAGIGPAIDPYLPGTVVPGLKGDPGGGPGGSVGPFSAISGMAIPAGINSFLVDDGGFMLADQSYTAADVAAYPLAVTKDQSGRYWKRDPSLLKLVHFGADPTGANPNFGTALHAALAYGKRNRVGVGSPSGLPPIEVAPGSYTSNTSVLHDDGAVCIYAKSGAGQAGGGCVTVTFLGNASGFMFLRSNDPRNPSPSSGYTQPDDSILDGLTIIGNGGAFGLLVGARIAVPAISVNGFATNIGIAADAGSGLGNANGWYFGRVRLGPPAAGGVCWSVTGGDGNGGHADLIDAVGGNVVEGPFLGANSYGTIQIAGGHFVGQGNANQSTVSCLYVEGGGGQSNWSGTGIFVSNVQAADGVAPGSPYGFGNAGMYKFGCSLSAQSTKNGRTITTNFASDAGSGFTRNIVDSADTSSVPFQFQEIIGNGSLRLSYNQNTIAVMTGASPTESFAQFGTGAAQPRVFAPLTFAKFNVAGTAGRREYVDSGPPTSGGPYAQGEYIRNIAPASGQAKGWFCTVTGSPGTWVADSNL